MKSTSCRLPLGVAIAVFAAALPLSATAADQAKSERLAASGVKAAQNVAGQSADDIIGQDVRSTTGQDLGEVQDLVVNTRNGRIVYALISTGGVLGIGDTIHVIPASAFKPQVGVKDALVVDLHGQDWQTSPTLKQYPLAQLGNDQRGPEIYRTFGRDWKKDLPQSDTSTTAAGNQLQRVSRINGRDVVQAGRDVGSIDDVIVDLQGCRAMALLDPDDDFTGTDRKFAIAFKQLSLDPADHDRYTTTLTAADFSKATPASDQNSDNDMNTAWNATTPYVWNYGYATGLGYTADTMGANSSGNDNRTPIAQIRRQLRDDPALAQAMNDVQLHRSGDQLVLTGQVRTDDLKDKIADKADDLAKGWDVENHIAVRAASE